MGMMQEFREFAVKGNVIDLAVDVIIGGAFGKIVGSAVDDLIMPLIGNLDFSNLFILLGDPPPGVALTLAELKKADVPVFAYGNFLTVALNFLILALAIFLLVKQINRLKRNAPAPAPAAAPPTPEDVLLLREIRDSLKQKG